MNQNRFRLLTLMLFCCFLAGTLFESYGQTRWKTGAITFPNGSTEQGQIQVSDVRDLGREIRFQSSASGAPVRYGPDELISFTVGEQRFLSATVDVLDKDFDLKRTQTNKTLRPKIFIRSVFLEVLVDGELNLYSYFDENYRETFYIRKGEAPIQALWILEFQTATINNQDISKQVKTAEIREMEVVEMKENFYLLQLGKEIKDCGQSLEKLKEVKLTRRSLIKFIADYHACKEGVPEELFLTENRKVYQSRFGLQVGVGMWQPYFSYHSEYPYLSAQTYEPQQRLQTGLSFQKSVLPFRKRLYVMGGLSLSLYRISGTYIAGLPDDIANGLYHLNDWSYASWETKLQIGAQYYFLSDKKVRPFVHGSLISNYLLNRINENKVTFHVDNEPQSFNERGAIKKNIDIPVNFGFSVGVGIEIGHVLLGVEVERNNGLINRDFPMDHHISEARAKLIVWLN